MNVEYIKNYPHYCLIVNLGWQSAKYEYFKNLPDAVEKFHYYANNLKAITEEILQERFIDDEEGKLCFVSLKEIDEISSKELTKLVNCSTEAEFKSEWDMIIASYAKTILHSYSFDQHNEFAFGGYNIDVEITNKDGDEEYRKSLLSGREMIKITSL